MALERLTEVRDEWSKERLKYLDYLNDRLRKEADAKQTFTDINEAMNEYYIVTGNRFALPHNLREELKLTDFYVPSQDQKNRRTKIISQDEETNVDGLPLRELLGLDKALQTTRGELVNNLAKLSELDQEINNLEKLYKNARDRDDEDVEVSEELREQLRDKQDERFARLEAASENQ